MLKRHIIASKNQTGNYATTDTKGILIELKTYSKNYNVSIVTSISYWLFLTLEALKLMQTKYSKRNPSKLVETKDSKRNPSKIVQPNI